MAKPELFYHDGQNYKILLNYYYATHWKKVQGPLGWVWSWQNTPLNDEVRCYETRQSVGRVFSNGNFGFGTIASALIRGYPSSQYIPTDPHYGQLIDKSPDYWTATGSIAESYRNVLTPAILLGAVPSVGGSIYQDVYKVSNQALKASTLYTLSFYAKGSGSGTRAEFQFYLGNSKVGLPISRPISSQAWPNNAQTETITTPNYIADPSLYFDHVRISFIADSGRYLYVSSTSFG